MCYDLRFAELYGHLAWECECDLILHPSAFIRNATFGSYHPFATTRAVENGVYLLSVNYRYAGERLRTLARRLPVRRGSGQFREWRTRACSPQYLGRRRVCCRSSLSPLTSLQLRSAYPYRKNRHPTFAGAESR